MQRDATRLWRLDPSSGDTVAGGKLGESGVSDAAVGRWIPLGRNPRPTGGVWKIDGRGVTAGKVETGALPWAVVPAAGSLWVSNANDGTVTRIDPESDRTTTIEVGHRRLGLAVAGDRVWVSLGLSAEDARARIVGSRVLTAAVVGDPVDTTDPAAGPNEESLALVQATGLRLMDYRVRRDGVATVVPEAAVGPPVVSKDGLRYTFRVRSGFAFSPPSTEKVTAETFRTSVDRAREQKTSYCGYVLSVIKRIPYSRRHDHLHAPACDWRHSRARRPPVRVRGAERCPARPGRCSAAASERGAVLPGHPRVRAADRAATEPELRRLGAAEARRDRVRARALVG